MEQNVSIKWYKTIDSTNTQGAREAAESEEGTVWVADFQTNGRGQRGNKWESSAAKNLTFTILFKPLFLHPARQFAITEVSALGVCRYLKEKGLQAKIKWPNDIYIGDRKICGMLIEHSLTGDKLSVSLSGIGLNLNQRIFNSDAPNPTSLILEMENSGATIPDEFEFDRKKELSGVLGHIFTAYTELQLDGDNALKEEYLNNLYRFGELHKFIETAGDSPGDIPVEKMGNGAEISARIIGVDDYGCLVLQHAGGEVKSYPFKGIKYVI